MQRNSSDMATHTKEKPSVVVLEETDHELICKFDDGREMHFVAKATTRELAVKKIKADIRFILKELK